jgi:hypothetical protein
LPISGSSTYCWSVQYHPFLIPMISEADMVRLIYGFIFASVLDLNVGFHHIKLDADDQKLWIIVFTWYLENLQLRTLTHGCRDCRILICFRESCLSYSKIWNMLWLSCYLVDLLILANNIFKDHLFKLEMVLARLSTNQLLVWEWMY